jgi:hypothetical protein
MGLLFGTKINIHNLGEFDLSRLGRCCQGKRPTWENYHCISGVLEFSGISYINALYTDKQFASTPKMSLARIPVTFLVCWAFKKCITPPNPPAAKSERLITNFMEIEWYTQRSPFYATVRFTILR